MPTVTLTAIYRVNAFPLRGVPFYAPRFQTHSRAHHEHWHRADTGGRGGGHSALSSGITRFEVVALKPVLQGWWEDKPVFKEGQVEVHIPENAPVGTSVIQLHATDADIGSNAEIRYIFGAQVAPATKRLFALNNTTGLITDRKSVV